MTSQNAATSKPSWLVLVATVLASSLAFIDSSVVNVALPALARDLAASADGLQWIVNAYLLPLSAVMLFGGAAGDRFGRRRLLLLGTMFFAIASLGCALAPNLTCLLTARFLQGAGGAFLMPNSLAILGQSFAGEAKGRAVGIWAAASAVASALGPVLGGWLVDLAGWRYIFLINIPVAALAIVLATRYVTESATRPDTTLDVLGATLATIGLGALTWGLTLAGQPRPGQFNLMSVLILGAVSVIAVFIMIEKHRGDRALVPLGIFATAPVVGLNLVTLLLYGALGALVVLLPYELIEALGYSATRAAAAMLPLPVVAALLSPPAGSLAERVGARIMITLGAVAMGLGVLLMVRISPGVTYWKGTLPAVLMVSIGLSAAVAPITTAVLGEVDARFTGVASALNTATARMGGLLATSMVGSVFAVRGASTTDPFHRMMLIFAGVSVGTALIAVTLLRGRNRTAA